MKRIKKREVLLLILGIFYIAGISTAQKSSNNFMRYYPIGEDPNICYKSTYVKKETILFEANPNIRYSLYNNFLQGLSVGRQHTQAWFIESRSSVRMYNDNSFPIKTPTYRFFIGTQHIFRISDTHLAAFSIENGHYSNGQTMSALSEKYDEPSKGSDSLYALITPQTNLSDVINRKTGNFSTNLVEFILLYRINKYDGGRVPYKSHSLKIGMVAYQKRFAWTVKFGGYSDKDIKLYGRYRYLLGYEYLLVCKKGKGIRLSFAENIEWLQGAHHSVQPLRSESTFTIYPFTKSNSFGFFVSYIYGHDNYNLRFVDSGNQIALGFSWSQFPPSTIKKMEKQ